MQVGFPIYAGIVQRAAKHGVAGGQPDSGDLFALQIRDGFERLGIFRRGDNGGILAHDAANDADVRAFGDVYERGRGAERAQIQLAGAEGRQAVRRIGEFHQLHIQPFRLEEPLLLGDEEFGVSRHGQMADLDRDQVGVRRQGGTGDLQGHRQSGQFPITE